MKFEFATATRIVFGAATLSAAAQFTRELSQRALIVTGSTASRSLKLDELLGAEKVSRWTLAVSGEPTLDDIEQGVQLAKSERIEVVVSLGGGSVIDAGKAIAAMMTNEGEVLDYVEVIGRGKQLTHASALFIAIPTTAGTGAEVTRNAVLLSPEHRVKVSLRSPLMLPRLAVVDPELTYDLPPALTASTGLDALTQLIEPYVSCRANPMTDALCVEGILLAARSLRRVFENGRDVVARENMALASLFGGMALANAGLGAVHGFAAPIGGMFSAPHGAVCAALLPHVMAANIRALCEREPNHEALRRYEEVSRLVTGKLTATADDGVQWADMLVSDLQIPKLGMYGIASDNVDELVQKASQASSMKGNPIVLTADELAGVLRAAM